jgi:DNA-binding NarL/FixJ family response regulator
MSKLNIQIDDVVREMTDEEQASLEAEQALFASMKAEQEAKVIARESALAKLAALGLTEEEIAAL